MGTSFEKVIGSSLFTFQVGPEKREFTVHSMPLAGLSSTLNTLLNGQMIEATTRHVQWPDVDEETFIRLCEYAYLGDYTPPTPQRPLDDGWGWGSRSAKSAKLVNKKKKKKGSDSSNAWGGVASTTKPFWEVAEEVAEEVACVEPETTPVIEDADLAATEEARLAAEEEAKARLAELLPYVEKNISTRDLCDEFSNLSTANPPPARPISSFTPRGNIRASEDFTPVFLGHTQLYILADQYGIQALCRLILSKLSDTLTEFHLFAHSLAAVLGFIRFVYLDEYRNITGIAPLKRLVVQYVVSVLGQIGEAQAFQDLLTEGGDFVGDLWKTMWAPDKSTE